MMNRFLTLLFAVAVAMTISCKTSRNADYSSVADTGAITTSDPSEPRRALTWSQYRVRGVDGIDFFCVYSNTGFTAQRNPGFGLHGTDGTLYHLKIVEEPTSKTFPDTFATTTTTTFKVRTSDSEFSADLWGEGVVVHRSINRRNLPGSSVRFAGDMSWTFKWNGYENRGRGINSNDEISAEFSREECRPQPGVESTP